MKTILETPAQAASARHTEGVSFRCHDCGEVKPVQTSGGTGYARCTDPDGEHLVCYACTDKRQTAELLTRDTFTGYISGDGRNLTTWTGGILGRISFGSRHPWSRERYYVRAYDVHGQSWHGTGANSMWCNLRKCKA
jgi:hypothetical protein